MSKKSNTKQNTTENKVTESNIETIPSPTQLDRDEMQFQKLLQFANLARLIKRDLNENKIANSTFNRTYKKSDVIGWLANPGKYEKQLRDLSRFLFDSSSHYKRLIDYFSTMLTFDYVVDIYNQTNYEVTKELKDNIQKRYINTINKLENMNMKHEFSKLITKSLIDGIVYGYEYSTKNSYFIDILNPDYCAISSIEDGVYNYSFNFQYFDIYKEEINRFSEEFQEKYEIYKTDKRNKKWQELDSSKTICIKISDSEHAVPMLAGVFEEIYSLYTYKDLQMSKTEMDNYLLLVASIPYQKDANDRENAWALSLDIAEKYFGMMSDNLPEQIGTILSPFSSIEPIKLSKNEKELDTLTLAENSIYNSAGVPRMVFNSEKASGAVLNKAISMDESTMFKILRQIERWVNRKLKDENKKIHFKVTFLNITEHNRKDMIDKYKDASTLGLPVKRHFCAALGLSPSDVMNSILLENDVLGITDKFIPLSSSYTQSHDDKGGRPDKGDDVEEITEIGDDLDTNNPENRS
ncbi:MAG: hypothetical protein PWQ45_1519 [Thermosipho sp. (in: thermotogales)]|nr:hypothetical protein [Thermosipho sp. (in: thermotogales)]